MRRSLLTVLLLAVAGASSIGCRSGPKTYASRVQLARFDVVHSGPDGSALTGDAEIEWLDCPGEQREVTRGDAAFVRCMSKYRVGDALPVRVEWAWEDGHYDWDLTSIGDCARPPESHDESSFDMVQECEPRREQGVVVGVMCTRVPQRALLDVCPWFRRR